MFVEEKASFSLTQETSRLNFLPLTGSAGHRARGFTIKMQKQPRPYFVLNKFKIHVHLGNIDGVSERSKRWIAQEGLLSLSLEK